MTGEKITEQNEDMRVLITYKGSAEIGKEFQDDYMILELVTDGRPDALASAVVNFPLLDGNKSIFIHDLVSYESMGDVAAVARCRIASDEQGVTSFLVTKENMECFQMTQGEIMEQAYHNTAAQKYTLQNLNEIMRELMTSEGLDPEIVKELTHEETPLYVLTNSERVNGANAIVCPEVLKHVYEELGENYYIMPSSIHEVLLVKESTGLTPDEMKRMVHEVNVSEVRPEELLSFKVFRYDGRKLSVVNEEIQEISEAKEKIKQSKIIH